MARIRLDGSKSVKKRGKINHGLARIDTDGENRGKFNAKGAKSAKGTQEGRKTRSHRVAETRGHGEWKNIWSRNRSCAEKFK